MIGAIIALVTQSTGISLALRILKVIPWQVYVIVACLCGVLYYGHWSRERGIQQGRAEIVAITAKAAQAEVSRQAKAKDQIIAAEKARADAAESANVKLQKDVDDALAKAKASPTAGRDCLPADSVRRLRHLK